MWISHSQKRIRAEPAMGKRYDSNNSENRQLLEETVDLTLDGRGRFLPAELA
jgi:hypothetical protein